MGNRLIKCDRQSKGGCSRVPLSYLGSRLLRARVLDTGSSASSDLAGLVNDLGSEDPAHEEISAPGATRPKVIPLLPPPPPPGVSAAIRPIVIPWLPPPLLGAAGRLEEDPIRWMGGGANG